MTMTGIWILVGTIYGQTPFDGATVDPTAGGAAPLALRILAIVLGLVGIAAFGALVLAIGKYSAAKASGYEHKMVAAQSQIWGALIAIGLVAAALTVAQLAWDIGASVDLSL